MNTHRGRAALEAAHVHLVCLQVVGDALRAGHAVGVAVGALPWGGQGAGWVSVWGLARRREGGAARTRTGFSGPMFSCCECIAAALVRRAPMVIAAYILCLSKVQQATF